MTLMNAAAPGSLLPLNAPVDRGSVGRATADNAKSDGFADVLSVVLGEDSPAADSGAAPFEARAEGPVERAGLAGKGPSVDDGLPPSLPRNDAATPADEPAAATTGVPENTAEVMESADAGMLPEIEVGANSAAPEEGADTVPAAENGTAAQVQTAINAGLAGLVTAVIPQTEVLASGSETTAAAASVRGVAAEGSGTTRGNSPLATTLGGTFVALPSATVLTTPEQNPNQPAAVVSPETVAGQAPAPTLEAAVVEQFPSGLGLRPVALRGAATTDPASTAPRTGDAATKASATTTATPALSASVGSPAGEAPSVTAPGAASGGTTGISTAVAGGAGISGVAGISGPTGGQAPGDATAGNGSTPIESTGGTDAGSQEQPTLGIASPPDQSNQTLPTAADGPTSSAPVPDPTASVPVGDSATSPKGVPVPTNAPAAQRSSDAPLTAEARKTPDAPRLPDGPANPSAGVTDTTAATPRHDSAKTHPSQLGEASATDPTALTAASNPTTANPAGSNSTANNATAIGQPQPLASPTPTPATANAPATTTPTPMGQTMEDLESVARQLHGHLSPLRHLRDGRRDMTVMLHPEELGALRIRVEVRDGVVALQMAASGDSSRDLLQNAMPQLKQQLAEAGLSLGSTNVSTSGGENSSFGEAMSRQGQQGSREATPARRGFEMSPNVPAPTRVTFTTPAGGLDVSL